MDKNLLNMKINNSDKFSKLQVTFKKNNENITKDIYILMTEDMINNIRNKHNIQYFMDVTYYETPPPNVNKYKLLIIIAFNLEEYKTTTSNISILSNENKPTFITILEHLKIRYNFYPNKLTIDYYKAEFSAIKTIFPNSIIIPCFFHFIMNISKKIPNLKSKNKSEKTFALDLLSNIKLLCFMPNNKIKNFYQLIKQKYLNSFKEFFKYFDKYYINSNFFTIDIWNYNKVILNHINDRDSIIFFTNNICESFNRSINKKYIGYCKTMFIFKRCIFDIIDLYSNHTKYKDKRLSITRSLEHYEKITHKFELITNKELKIIIKNYQKFLEENNLPQEEEDFNYDDEEYYFKKISSDFSDSDSDLNEIETVNDWIKLMKMKMTMMELIMAIIIILLILLV